MNPSKITYLLLPLFVITQFSCEWEPNKPDLPEEVLILNNWIWEGMNQAYLWEQQLPDLDPDYQPDPEAYFYDLLYTSDRYSWIEEDREELVAMLDGAGLATGMSARPGKISETQVISIVEYVTPDSPAEDSAIQRGDIILTIDGQSLTTENYYPLFFQNTATFEFGDWDGSQVVSNGRKVTLSAIEFSQNPVVHSEVIDYQGTKIGYLVFTQFTYGPDDEWFEELNSVFEEFKTAAVSDLVVDLRYNRGGYGYVSAYIASTLAPRSTMENEEIFISLEWNDAYKQFWMEYDLDKDGQPDGENSTQLVERFTESELNMDLSKVYFFTTESTASASESLMTGLYPYMDVVQIGTTTYGKCYGSITIDDWADPKRHNWAMQPIVFKYVNAAGFTDFVNGIDPDFEVVDDLLYAEPFGSFDDPLLAKALENITGVAPVKKSLMVQEHPFNTLPVPKNKMVEQRISLIR
jgi:carboxyl-terminal processing protease